MAPEAMLERARHFRSLVVETERHAVGPSIFTWRAKFTFAHVGDRGFTGGFFQQHDEHYTRNCLMLDYTPELFSEVLAKFKAWMDPYYQTQRITVDGRVVWVVEKGA
jgi:tRNA/tmRNA/rRNA uracil-C5-methylase (TrmA/RlmC/RlmD family)